MSTIDHVIELSNQGNRCELSSVSQPLSGATLSIGNGFEAESFRARDIGGVMDPLVMVDHYVMTEPTFGAHPHAGMSAVTLLFDDSTGLFHNRDSLGNDFDLEPGDLYWLKAGSGAVHDESPRPGACTHGLQVFVNLPDSRRFDAPASLLVRAKDMPVIETDEYRVKVVLGESNGVRGALSPTLSMNILDGFIHPDGKFVHEAAFGRGMWIHAIKEDLTVITGEEARHLDQGQALAINSNARSEVRISNDSENSAHFVMFDGERIDEKYVQDGPFVMTNQKQIADLKAAYNAGQLGSIAEK